jgi:hypothetical protein
VKRKILQKVSGIFSETHFSFPFGGVRSRSHIRRGVTFSPSKQRKKNSLIYGPNGNLVSIGKWKEKKSPRLFPKRRLRVQWIVGVDFFGLYRGG